MFIRGRSIHLRALEPADSDLIYTWENDMNVWAVSGTQLPFSRYVIDHFVNASHQDIYTNKQLRLMVQRNDNNATIGMADIFEFDPANERCGLGIYIHPDERGQGAAEDCIRVLASYCFDTLHLHQVYADVLASNTASLALFTKCGFRQTGVRIHWRKTAVNRYEDMVLLQLLNPAGV